MSTPISITASQFRDLAATDSAPVVLWCSYVGRGAPSNAAGNRTGLGSTKVAASTAAGHWANQAAYERFRRVTLRDAGMSLRDEHAARKTLGYLIDVPEPTAADLAAKKILDAHQWAGGWASAWRALHS